MSYTPDPDDTIYGSRPGTSSTTNTTPHTVIDLTDRPPIPPIPSSQREEAWRRRSARRSTLDSATLAAAIEMSSEKQDVDVRTARTQSMMSVTATLTSVRPRRTEPDLHAELHWEINAHNPRNWHRRKKYLHTLYYATLAFPCTFAATTIVPAHDALVSHFRCSSTAALFPLTLYLAGVACGHFLGGLGSEMLGRKKTLTVGVALFALFILVSGLSYSLAGVIVCRLLAGLFAGTILLQAWFAISDLWTPGQIILPSTLSVACALAGPAIGLVVGGYATSEQSWRWSQFVALCVTAAWALPVVALKETSKKRISRSMNKEAIFAPMTSQIIRTVLSQPFHMIFVEPIILLYSLSSASVAGISYGLLTALPTTFAQAYGFDDGSQGLCFISMAVGATVGVAMLLLFDALVYLPRASRYKKQQGTEEEKALWIAPKPNTRPSTRGRSHSIIRSETERAQKSRSVSRPRSRSAGGRASRIIQSMARSSRQPTFIPPADFERNVNMATAAAKYLNSLKVNEGRYILPERILLLLNQHMEFSHVCQALEGYKLSFDRVNLATALVEGISRTTDGATPHPDSCSGTPHARSRSNTGTSMIDHRKAAAEALESREPVPPLPATISPPIEKRRTWIPPANVPPAEWRLWAALPASALMIASLFFLGWTAHAGVSWIAPIVALGLFAFSALLIVVSLSLYVLACYGPKYGAAGMAGSSTITYIFGSAFSLFALPMYRAVGAGWASSVFAFVAVVAGALPAVLYISGPMLRRRQKYKEQR